MKILLMTFLIYFYFQFTFSQEAILLERDSETSGDYLTADDDVLDLGTGDFTLEVKMVVNLFPPVITYGSKIINKGLSLYGTPINAGYGLRIYEEGGNNKLIFEISDGTGFHQLEIDGLLTDNCYHIAAVREGENIRLFLNGVLVASDITPTVINVNSNLYFSIGALDRQPISFVDEYFDGKIDEVRIWNVARREDLIYRLMDDSLSMDYYSSLDSGLVAYYRCDEFENLGTGTPGINDVRDFSINGYHVDAVDDPITTSSCTIPFPLTVSVANGWNLLSIPGLHPTDQNVNTWWPNRDLSANVFRFLSAYIPVTEAVPGVGYFLKHSGDKTYNTGDEWPAGGIIKVPNDPIPGAAGWNLFGGYELSVAESEITTNPLGLRTGPIYKYLAGFVVATTIDPGHGYWMKLSGSGQIIIPSLLSKKSAQEYFPKEWGRIIITDATGISYTLYVVNGEVDLSQYELPPAPMEGMFDIRFSSGKIAEDLNSAIKTIEMSGVTYPLTVRVEGVDIKLMDETGKNVNVNLKSGEDVVISDATISKLMVSGELIPAKYALEQNYPNPFNPVTTIKYSIAQNNLVTIKVYDVLGKEVATLVNEEKPAGVYEIEFSASEIASGIYLYKLQAGDFVQTRKMILLK